MKKFLYMFAIALFMAFPVAGAAGAAESSSNDMGGSSMGPDGMMQDNMTMPQGAVGDSTASRLDPDTIRSVQQALNDRGFRDTPVDGNLGVSTQAALMDFQRERGLMATGQPDAQTLQALGVPQNQTGGGQGTMMQPDTGSTGMGGEESMGMDDGMHTGDR